VKKVTRQKLKKTAAHIINEQINVAFSPKTTRTTT